MSQLGNLLGFYNEVNPSTQVITAYAWYETGVVTETTGRRNTLNSGILEFHHFSVDFMESLSFRDVPDNIKEKLKEDFKRRAIENNEQ